MADENEDEKKDQTYTGGPITVERALGLLDQIYRKLRAACLPEDALRISALLVAELSYGNRVPIDVTLDLVRSARAAIEKKASAAGEGPTT